MSGPFALLDVNVPMYAAGRDHPYKLPCAWVMREVVEGRIAAAIDTEMSQEVLNRFGSLHDWATATTMAISLLELTPEVYSVKRDDARLAIELFKRYAPKGVTARDVIHVAVMQNNGMTEIISADRHFDQIDGITRLDPQDLFRSASSRSG